MKRKSNFLTKFAALTLSLLLVFSMSSTALATEAGSTAAQNGDLAFTSISTQRLSMTEKEDVTVTFNLGYEPKAKNLEWYFGDKPFSEWENTMETPEPVFQVKSMDIGKDGNVTAVISVNYLFDGDDAAYWRPWYAYRGMYDLKVVDKSTKKSAAAEIRYEVYDSYHPYSEIDSTVEDIIKNKKNNIYISWESTGKSADGKDIKVAVVAKNKSAADKYLQLKERAESEPEKVMADLKAGRLGDYQVPFYITNIHANESPGVDAQLAFLKSIADEKEITYLNGDGKEVTYKVQDILDDLILIIRPTENPYALEQYQRANAEGFDLNRDNTYQTQQESRVATADIVKWDPVMLTELHGFLYDARTQIMIEPCTPPHEPNLEYDLFMNYALDGANAFGEAASVNSVFKATKEQAAEYGVKEGDPWYEICIEENLNKETNTWDYPSDDMSTNYTPTYALFHGTIGYTVECGELNEDSVTMLKYGLIGQTAYAAENKDKLYLNQLEFFRRANAGEESAETERWFVNQKNQVEKNFREKNENGKFYPEYYVIPTDAESQRDLSDAWFMEEYLLRNGVKVERLTEDVIVDGTTYQKGAIVVDMHQAKRSMANAVLYKGVKVEDWTGLFSESVTNFPAMRGFDCDAITKVGAFTGKTEPVLKAESGASVVSEYGTVATVIANDSLDAVKAVNQLLADGVKVGFITVSGKHYDAGDFVIDYKDADKIGSEYILKITNVDRTPKAKIIKEPKVYLCGDQFDQFAFEKQMNFKTVDKASSANVVFASGEPDQAAQAKIKKGLPFVGASCYVLEYAKSTLPGFDYVAEGELDYWGDFEYNSNEALFKVNYGKSLITASYEADNDDTIYTKGGSYIKKIPAGATKLITAQTGKDFYLAGWWNTIDTLKGKTVAIDYQKNGLNMTIFANSITNKAHQTDDYRLATNAIYSKLLGDDFAVGKDTKAVKAVTGTKIVSLKAVKTGSQVKLTWKKSKSPYKVDGYQVWRSTKKTSGFTKAVTVKGKSCTVKQTGTRTWYYKVRGYRMLSGNTYYTQWSSKVAVK